MTTRAGLSPSRSCTKVWGRCGSVSCDRVFGTGIQSDGSRLVAPVKLCSQDCWLAVTTSKCIWPLLCQFGLFLPSTSHTVLPVTHYGAFAAIWLEASSLLCQSIAVTALRSKCGDNIGSHVFCGIVAPSYLHVSLPVKFTKHFERFEGAGGWKKVHARRLLRQTSAPFCTSCFLIRPRTDRVQTRIDQSPAQMSRIDHESF